MLRKFIVIWRASQPPSFFTLSVISFKSPGESSVGVTSVITTLASAAALDGAIPPPAARKRRAVINNGMIFFMVSQNIFLPFKSFSVIYQSYMYKVGL